MGEVKVKVLLKNYGNVWAHKNGYITEKEVPSSLLDMIVDTEAVLVFLPPG